MQGGDLVHCQGISKLQCIVLLHFYYTRCSLQKRMMPAILYQRLFFNASDKIVKEGYVFLAAQTLCKRARGF